MEPEKRQDEAFYENQPVNTENNTERLSLDEQLEEISSSAELYKAYNELSRVTGGPCY